VGGAGRVHRAGHRGRAAGPSRLERKDLVARDRDGRAHRYRATASREEHAAELMREALDTAVDRGAALASFAKAVSPGEAEALADALTEALRRRGAPGTVDAGEPAGSPGA
jgi:hypothetical protein